jgi:hypothetical protein
MAEALKTFREGEDILASETNDNNQYLLSRLSDNAAQVQKYVEGEVATIKSNVSSVQATLQNNIKEVQDLFETFSQNIYKNIIPDYSKGVSVGHSFTAPANGIYTVTLNYNNSGAYFRINGANAFYYQDGDGVSGSVNTPFTIPLAKGDECSWSAYVEIKYAQFFPFRGEIVEEV